MSFFVHPWPVLWKRKVMHSVSKYYFYSKISEYHLQPQSWFRGITQVIVTLSQSKNVKRSKKAKIRLHWDLHQGFPNMTYWWAHLSCVNTSVVLFLTHMRQAGDPERSCDSFLILKDPEKGMQLLEPKQIEVIMGFNVTWWLDQMMNVFSLPSFRIAFIMFHVFH